eukprot:TRINITY_DN225_c0_g2_i14.p1 TRINITY_DN225_c0_g2~~TRINITY_DN225_c0_g2_i14.p1  ORF type:complete len:102 (-),score=15.03 TRINITY_DN225_c0_g2_i14:116-421(-)
MDDDERIHPRPQPIVTLRSVGEAFIEDMKVDPQWGIVDVKNWMIENEVDQQHVLVHVKTCIGRLVVEVLATKQEAQSQTIQNWSSRKSKCCLTRCCGLRCT